MCDTSPPPPPPPSTLIITLGRERKRESGRKETFLLPRIRAPFFGPKRLFPFLSLLHVPFVRSSHRQISELKGGQRQGEKKVGMEATEFSSGGRRGILLVRYMDAKKGGGATESVAKKSPKGGGENSTNTFKFLGMRLQFQKIV